MKRTYIENLDYKDLQKKCKELKLTAVGTKSILKNRLIEYFDKQVDDIDDVISSLNNITLEEHDFLYEKHEVIPMLNLGILIKYYFLNNIEIYPTKILQEYNNNNPDCILEDNRKILLINTIIYIFDFYKKTSTNSNILEELIENGYTACKQIYPDYTY